MGGTRVPDLEYALRWVLASSDGRQSLIDVAQRSRLSSASLERAAEPLEENGLLAREP